MILVFGTPRPQLGFVLRHEQIFLVTVLPLMPKRFSLAARVFISSPTHMALLLLSVLVVSDTLVDRLDSNCHKIM